MEASANWYKCCIRREKKFYTLMSEAFKDIKAAHISKLKCLRRKTFQLQVSQQALDSCVEVGRFGLDRKVDWWKRDKQVLMVELVKLRQQQQNTRTYIQSMEDRLRKTEGKQQQMMTLLARAMQNLNLQ